MAAGLPPHHPPLCIRRLCPAAGNLVGDGYRKTKRTAPVHLALDGELPVVELDELARDGHTQATTR